MKINLGYVFLEPHGKIVMDQEPGKDENGRPTMVDTVPFILGEALIRALDNDPEIAKADKKKKRDVWHLIEQIISARDGELDLSADEIVMVGDAIAKYFKPFIVGQAMDILDPVK